MQVSICAAVVLMSSHATSKVCGPFILQLWHDSPPAISPCLFPFAPPSSQVTSTLMQVLHMHEIEQVLVVGCVMVPSGLSVPVMNPGCIGMVVPAGRVIK